MAGAAAGTEPDLDVEDAGNLLPATGASRQAEAMRVSRSPRLILLGASGLALLCVAVVLLGVIARNVANYSSGGGEGSSTATFASVTVESMRVETLTTAASPDAPRTDPSVEGLTRGLVAQQSFVTAFTSGPGASSMLWEVPASALGRLFLVTASFERGDGVHVIAHMPADETNYDAFMLSLSPSGNTLELSRPQLDLRVLDDGSIEDAAETGTWQGPTKMLPVLARRTSPQNASLATSWLVDASELALVEGFFVADLSLVQPRSSPGSSLRDIAPRVLSVRGFPRNLEVVCEYHMRFQGAEGALGVALHFSIALLPDSPMRGRVADERVGFFTTSFTELGISDVPPSTLSVGRGGGASLQSRTAPRRARRLQARTRPATRKISDHVDRPVSFINRWRLDKQDPALDPSPVTRPITFHIDPTVPVQWRPYLKQGVEAWVPAFRAAGFDHAIRAVLPTDPDFPADYSAGDLRYSSISWAIDTETTYALGPSVTDPRSGEILNGDIVFTHGWVHSYMASFDTWALGGGPAAQAQRDDRSAPERGRADLHSRRGCQADRARATSDHSRGLFALMGALGMVNMTEQVIGWGLRDVTMHEVGHVLGLRHNFKGSLAVPLSALYSPDQAARGITSSVMDYLPVVLLSQPVPPENHFPAVVGAYDVAAIRYGYTPVEDEVVGEQPPQLLTMLASLNVSFGTDEDVPRVQGEDPFTNVFDLSADPLDFYEDRVALVRTLAADLRDRAVESGGLWPQLNAARRVLLNALSFVGTYACKYLGGSSFSKSRRGDTNAPSLPATAVSAPQTRRAVRLALSIVANDNMTLTPFDNLLVARTGVCVGLSQDCFGLASVDVRKESLSLRLNILNELLNPARLERLANQNFLGLSAYTLAEHLAAIRTALQTDPSSCPPSGSPVYDLQLAFASKLVSFCTPVVDALCGTALDTFNDTFNSFLNPPTSANTTFINCEYSKQKLAITRILTKS